MKFLDLKDISTEKLEEFIQKFSEHKDLKHFLGGCPPEKYRSNPNCFHCDDCWIEALTNAIISKNESQ